MPRVPDDAVEAARDAVYRAMYDPGTPFSDPRPFAECIARAAVEAAAPVLAEHVAQVPDLTAVPWRQGRRKGRNLYAVTGPDWEAHPEIGCLDTPELAAEAVAAHNEAGTLAANLAWLLAAGLEVEVAPCGGAGRCCGDADGRFSVRAAKPDPVAALPLAGGVESHGHASPAEALAFAREWCGQNGIAP